MAETARGRGVTASAVLVEPRSHNARERPVEALTLQGVASSMHMALLPPVGTCGVLSGSFVVILRM